MDTKKVFYLLIALGIVYNLFLIKLTPKQQEAIEKVELDPPVILLD